ncbi:hypothetical protein AB5J62_12375 [Amycolatopsis sp. cg5]|uniref:hypothetical protein n=1 Tax=Amycolatopsis sp. cg5 TaxID=3238802 RepID=UPI0035232C64
MRKIASVAAALLTLPLVPLPATAAPPPPEPQLQRYFTLPTGDHVLLTGHGESAKPRFLPAPGHSPIAVTSKVNGQFTVVPAGQLKHLTSLDAYRIGPAEPRGVEASSQMSLLHVKAVNHTGKKAAAAEVLVVNTDNLATASWDGVMLDGDARIQVPNGHYSVAVAIFDTDEHDNPVNTELLTQTDVTVSTGGATVALDGRAAHPVSFVTPLPSVHQAAVAGWERGPKGRLASFDIGAMAGTSFYVGAAEKPKYGVLNFSMVARELSPPSAPKPYSYFIGIPKADHVPIEQTYPVNPATLATVDSTYPTDLPGQDLILWDDWAIPGAGPANPAMPTLPYVEVHAPSADRRYVTVAPGLDYDGLMLPNDGGAPLDGELERHLTLKAGEHRSLTWRDGLILPAPATVDGPCFLCRTADKLAGVGVMDTDAAGDIGQWSQGTTTITEDGKQIYQDTTQGVMFEQALKAGKHRYAYSIDDTHDGVATNLSTHTQITWGFDSATTAKSAPLPIFYSRAAFNTDRHSSLAPGEATMSLVFQHQPGAADSPLKSAAVSSPTTTARPGFP